MGDTMTNIFSRLLGIILAALSVQFVMTGLQGAFMIGEGAAKATGAGG